MPLQLGLLHFTFFNSTRTFFGPNVDSLAKNARYHSDDKRKSPPNKPIHMPLLFFLFFFYIQETLGTLTGRT
jgi:hypothetical protein